MNVEAGIRHHIISQDCDFIWVAPALCQKKKMPNWGLNQIHYFMLIPYYFNSSIFGWVAMMVDFTTSVLFLWRTLASTGITVKWDIETVIYF